MTKTTTTPVYFAEYFGVSETQLARHGAFNISLVTDLPLFIDPFLLFNSKKPQYQRLHDEIIRYLRFLRDKAAAEHLDPGLMAAWYHFPEVKQTWLGFSESSNRGHGLGAKFAASLHQNLHKIFHNFGNEQITRGSHLEKLCLVKDGVGRDNISDFTTNLIRCFLAEYTQRFASNHIDPSLRKRIHLTKVRFNYGTETWESDWFDLPWCDGDYVLLTPKDMLTKDDTWINKTDLVDDFDRIPAAIPNDALRAQVNNYFRKQLPIKPSRKDEYEAVSRTILEFPELIDWYIRYKEEHGDDAESVSAMRVAFSQALYTEQFRELRQLLADTTEFFALAGQTYAEAHQRVAFLKDVIENKGGHRIFYVHGNPIEREQDLHILYRLTWHGTKMDVTREANDGRGPVDFKISRGAKDKTLVEFKLASNTQLARNLKKQLEIYQRASDAPRAIKVIVYFSDAEFQRVQRILRELNLLGNRDIVLIDASQDNKVSGSKAH
ncbi:MAG: hypothetical protein ACHQ9S_19255 [Candidatus Binatia bacterium]